MLDLKTVLVVCTATAALQAIAWCSVYLAWRHLNPMKYFSAGFAAITIGLVALVLRGNDPGAAGIILSNLFVKAGLLLLAEGLISLLGQKSRIGFWMLCLFIYGLFWIVVTLGWPTDIALRIHSSTVFTVIVMGLMSRALLRDRSLPRLLRLITIGVLLYYMAASLIHSAIEIGNPAQISNVTVMNDRNSWYLLQGNLFLIAIFACLLFMVSLRLSEKLKQNIHQLQQEVHERKTLQDKLNASLQAERALRDEQRDLMRVVAHEFRTPLAMMRNSIEMITLLNEPLPETTKERLQGVGEALSRLLLLVKRFLTHDNVSAFQPEFVSVEALVARIHAHFDVYGQSGRLSIHTSPTDALVCIDEDMILTVIINMIDNALKYSGADQPVKCRLLIESGYLEAHVADRGIGIPDAESMRIGRRFYRATNASFTPGSGVGVYAARKLLSYHRGSLNFRPNPGGGTVARMRLPLIASEATEYQEQEGWVA